MSEPLLNHLRQVQSRLRQILWLHGLSCVTIVAFGSLLVFSLLDWALRLDDSGVRLILALTTLGGTAWAGWRYLIQPLRKQMTGVGLALRIERRFPELRDQLASTVQFLESGADPRIGSPALQKQQIQATLRQVERTRLSDVFELRSVQRAGLAAIGVLLVGALLAGSFQSEAATALTRLMFPFSSTQWPRWTELEILNSELQPVTVAELSPLRIARGHTFMLYVANRRGAPPSDVRVEFEQPGEGGIVVQPLQHLTRRNKEGQTVELCSLQLSPQERELRFRIAGGDDRTPWLRAVAVPP
ncbi:MAG: hypothetical protein KDA79_19495, partial [Planctomycetaceae bacterium]|nr:hypothetical protein [Planctomycetaceae bacterium]